MTVTVTMGFMVLGQVSGMGDEVNDRGLFLWTTEV